MSNDVEDYGTNLIMATAIPLASTSVIVSSSSKVIDNNNIPSSQDDSAIIESPSSSPPPIAAEQPRGTRPQQEINVGSPTIGVSHRHVEIRNDVPNNNDRATTSVIRSSNRNNNHNVVIDEEQIAIDTDTDDDVILVQQPVETIELGEDDDDDEEVQIINTNQPIPKPLPAKKRKYLPSATIPPTPRLPESSTATSSAYSLLNDEPEMPEIGPLLYDLLDDHFGHLDFDLPLSEPASLASAEIIPSSSNSNGKSSGDLFITKSTTTEIAIQTDDFKPCVVNMETQTDESSLIKKRKW